MTVSFRRRVWLWICAAAYTGSAPVRNARPPAHRADAAPVQTAGNALGGARALRYKAAMSIEQPPRTTPAFPAENDRLAALAGRDPIAHAAAHQELGPHVWLSSQAEAGTELSFAPAGASETGFLLRMDTAGRSPWVSLSWAIDVETLRQGRYVGLICQVVSDGFFAFRPCLRLLQAQGFHDHFAPQHMAASGGAHLLQGHVEIPQAQLDDCQRAEIHLFFSGDAFAARFERLETLLMR
ncbi:hypothetical protein [Sedimentitalea sp. HM32M-2]|uniref:hypothetical protein n=1 Tax=Sedimentitalea sp. HM32M-2 TaxID=3351566 RepID=UPI0036D3921B